MIIEENFFVVFFFSLIVSFIIFYIFKKNHILIDKTFFSAHKKLINSPLRSPPLCGGLIIFICSLFFFKESMFLNLFGLLMLILGIFSDSNKISSPKIRFFLQVILLLSFVLLIDLRINDIRVNFLNKLLNINLISIIFTIFCILVLINGSNFIDGLNTLLLGYYILVCSFLIFLSNEYNLVLNQNINLFLIFLIVIFLFNFFGKFFLGDSGAYLISFYLAFFVIDFSTKNNSVSPYLICFLLWYPAFENLFSILRRTIKKKKVQEPDQNHLHQMIYNFLTKKKLINHKIINTSTGLIINFFNIIMFLIFYKFYSKTDILVIGITINIFVYLSLYFFIKKKLEHHK
jgi:UDP-N-acetylmuramyl pentapeptide phosphotransferase/UDP-N-acetylglucosamine-1-phosphate transferase